MVIMLGFSACTEDLDTEPLDDDEITPVSVYEDAEGYKQVLAKLYGGLTLTGQQGPAGMPDLDPSFDEGFSSYLRAYWTHQELPTDEAVIAWNDPGLPAMNYATWGASNGWINTMYNRIYFQITLCNELVRESTDGKLSDRGITGEDREAVKTYRSEARFLRAFSYWHAIDMFGTVPFVTEDDDVGSFEPSQRSRSEVFEYIENELLDILENGSLKEPQQNEYGRIDKAAVWMLLSKLYLNAEVYTGTPRYEDAMTYAERVINSPYQLDPDYQHLFLADNHTADGIIFPVISDGENAQSYGGMNFIIHAAVGGEMNATEDFGIGGGWGGPRITKQFYNQFNDTGNDNRALFFTQGQSLEIPDVTEFTNGYAVSKFKNVTSEDEAGSVPGFVDTDWPVFRIAEAYLTYAEAALRAGSNTDKALTYVNEVRDRAFDGDAGQITSGELDLDFILAERARELYWEGKRRTDLIRFGEFTGDNYLWAWKGGTQEGSSIPDYYNLFPIPAADLNANSNLEQNPGY